LLDATRAQGSGQAWRQVLRQGCIASLAAGLDEVAGDPPLVLAGQAQGEAGAVGPRDGQGGAVERGQGGECGHGGSIVERGLYGFPVSGCATQRLATCLLQAGGRERTAAPSAAGGTGRGDACACRRARCDCWCWAWPVVAPRRRPGVASTTWRCPARATAAAP